MARPRKQPGKARNEKLQVRFTGVELALLKVAAGKEDVSSWARRVLLGRLAWPLRWERWEMNEIVAQEVTTAAAHAYERITGRPTQLE